MEGQRDRGSVGRRDGGSEGRERSDISSFKLAVIFRQYWNSCLV